MGHRKEKENATSVTVCEAHCKDYTVVCEHSEDCSCPNLALCERKCQRDPAMLDWTDRHVCAMRNTRIGEDWRSECHAICSGIKILKISFYDVKEVIFFYFQVILHMKFVKVHVHVLKKL